MSLRKLRLLAAPLLAALLVSAACGPALAATAPSISGCPAFPADSVWNTDIASMPVNSHSASWMASMGSAGRNLHPDFGSSGDPAAPYGIPYTVVDSSHARVRVTFDYASESDPGPYPFGTDTPIEGGVNAGGDRHALMVDRSSCTLYELYNARYSASGSTAGSGATWSLGSNSLRPASWTSADAAGLPIFPGLLRPEEVAAGYVGHAIRFTAARTDRSYLWPARHQAGAASDATLPPMGARFRLRAGFDESRFSASTKVVLEAMKHFGMMLADNGSNWFFEGAASNAWSDTLISELKSVPASSFEAIDESGLQVSANSGQARQAGTPPPPPPPPGGRTLTPTAAVEGADGGLWVKPGNGGFHPLGGSLAGAPAVVTGPASAAQSVYVATGTDHDLWVRSEDLGWQRLNRGGSVFCLDGPAATVSAGTLYLACQGGDHQLWHAEAPWSGSGLPLVDAGAWGSRGGVLAAGPAIAVTGGQPYYFVIGADGAAWEWAGGGFSRTPWACIGHPAATFDAGGDLLFACHGNDGRLWFAAGSGSSAGVARPLGGNPVDGVGMASTASGVTLYIEGGDGQLWQTSSAGTGWSASGGRLLQGAGGGAE